MLHLIFEGKPWFAAKRYGLGSGLPIRWQGWALIATHMALILGLAMALDSDSVTAMIAIMVAATVPLPIYAARTEGGWRWRWGG